MLKVVIHVGPPKTGTSALQNWLLQNRLWLQQNGIYYPEHGVDVNGVSSGNVDSLYDRNKERHLIFNPDKLIEVNDNFLDQAKNCQNILEKSGFKLITKLNSQLFKNSNEGYDKVYNQIWKR